MQKRDTLVAAMNRYLQVEQYQDYCPNGLQVEGREQVKRVITGVTASQALLDAAIVADADMVLVHHGYFWRGENPCVTGMRKQRLHTLLKHDLNLVAYHLPLDGHDVVGNNAQLAQRLDIIPSGRFGDMKPQLGWVGRLAEPMRAQDFAVLVEERLGRAVLHVGEAEDMVETVAWCSGAAQGFIEQAQETGVDVYLSGEISEPTAHVARETGIHYIAAGHHATERYGVQALGDWLAEEYGVEHQFIDIDNPA